MLYRLSHTRNQINRSKKTPRRLRETVRRQWCRGHYDCVPPVPETRETPDTLQGDFKKCFLKIPVELVETEISETKSTLDGGEGRQNTADTAATTEGAAAGAGGTGCERRGRVRLLGRPPARLHPEEPAPPTSGTRVEGTFQAEQRGQREGPRGHQAEHKRPPHSEAAASKRGLVGPAQGKAAQHSQTPPGNSPQREQAQDYTETYLPGHKLETTHAAAGSGRTGLPGTTQPSDAQSARGRPPAGAAGGSRALEHKPPSSGAPCSGRLGVCTPTPRTPPGAQSSDPIPEGCCPQGEGLSGHKRPGPCSHGPPSPSPSTTRGWAQAPLPGGHP
ncbi:PREDICTED: splicing factor, proline- and glutamine-rich-like [Bison bison bison]|uniref:Splicing factor, proline- and glutamine-rich-like n=1 Tax=Bison bison bison TaxID=43346 RepID=A0A6P3HBK9_BISBB|nr:PREDICTED: splicing factor, proline- and glutamine-rich-like [Bison bison bison]